MYAGKKGSYQLDLKLFGVIQFKNIQVDVVDTTRLIPCGSPVGIYLKSKGIMVIGTEPYYRGKWDGNGTGCGKIKIRGLY